MSEKLYGILLQEAIPTPDKPQKIKNLVVNKEAKELIEKQSKEIERLNNIINELEELCKNKYYEKNTTDIDSIAIAGNLYVYMYKKIKELKENNNAKDKR